MRSESFKAGTTIFIEGQPGATMYIITAGSVDIFVRGMHIAVVRVGGIIGETALISRRPRSATIIAHTDCTLVPIEERQLAFLVQKTSSVATQIMQTLSDPL